MSLISQINPDAKIVQEQQRIRPEKSEVFRLYGSNEKIQNLTDWKVTYSLADGLRETIEWFSVKQNLNQYKHDIYNI